MPYCTDNPKPNPDLNLKLKLLGNESITDVLEDKNIADGPTLKPLCAIETVLMVTKIIDK